MSTLGLRSVFAALLFLASALPSFAQMTLSGSVSPKPVSYIGTLTYSASSSGGDPATKRYAFFRRRPGGTWIPSVNSPNWQSGSTFQWNPTINDVGTWETYIWVKDGNTPPTQNTYGYAAGYNTMPVDVIGPPTVPGATTVSCAYAPSGQCWVTGDFTVSVSASSGGLGSISYQICRSNDTTGWGGCDVNLTLNGGTSYTVSGSHLPADGYQRAYYFQARDSAGAYSGWNSPKFVKIDRYAPSVSATNASATWYSYRTATVSASDSGSGLQSVRYSWNSPHNSSCTSGTSTSSGSTLVVPAGDNALYLCAKDNVGRVAQWSGQYRVSPIGLSGSVSPTQGSYLGTFTYTASASGGTPSTYRYAFFRRRPGGTWIPDVNAPSWQAGNTFTWQPASSDTGTWETYIWVKDGNTPSSMNTYGYAAGYNTMPITVNGPPTVPGPTTTTCAYTASGECWVQGDFTASVTASTGGQGSLVYQICRSNDTTGFGGCDVNLTLTGGTSILVSGTHLPSDGYRRAYYFQAKDSAGAYSGWNTPLYVRADRYAPTVSASNASGTEWFYSRTAVVSASDAHSGLQSVRYSWSSALDAACTTGTATSSGASLAAPVGDNTLYLCAKDNTGRVAQWNGRYRIANSLSLTACSVTPASGSYTGGFTWSATASGGIPSTTRFAFFRRRPGGAWIPDVSAPTWLAGNSWTWNPTSSDAGTWETYIWVKDGNTPPTQNTYGYAAGCNPGPITVVGPPTVPGPTTVSCAYTAADNCWVQGDFTASVTASTGGSGTIVYQICRSNDTATTGGCDVNLTLTGGTSILVSGAHLPADGYRRAFYFRAKDSANAYSGWNTPRYVRVDRYAPALSASNASAAFFSHRTATVTASDGQSGLQGVRYSWNTALDAACTTGTATSSGSVLTAPSGDNVLHLCAKDNTGRVAQWSGQYRVSPLGLTGTVAPKPASYQEVVTYTATATGGTPATRQYAFFRRRPGAASWIPDVTAPNWQVGNTFAWQPVQADVGTWETYIWVKDGDTPATLNTHGYAAGFNTMPIDIVGAPTVPGPTTVSCAWTTTDDCWVQGDFTASVTASTGGKGSLVYQICRSNDTATTGGCDVNLALTGGTSILVSGTHLPGDGYRRAYYFQAKDAAGVYSGWNTPRYVRVDRVAPTVSASNASDSWFRSRTAVVSASDTGSGLATVRYRWNAALDANCTTGTATSSGATLTVPSGDSTLYLCAKDNTGRVTQWNGRYKVAPSPTITVTQPPATSSYLNPVTWTVTPTGGVPGTHEYAISRRRTGSNDPWISSAWQSSNVFTWQPAIDDAGSWDNWIVVRDSLTAPDENGTGYSSHANAGTVVIVGKPTVPGATTLTCNHASPAGECWVWGEDDVTVSVTPSTGGMGSLVYQICRSNDTTGFGGCEVNLTLNGGTSIVVPTGELPADGFRRAYWFQARDSAGALSGWNTPAYLRVDRNGPEVSADNASDQWFNSRTATITASDEWGGAAVNSGLREVRYAWNGDACANGTVVAPGTTLTAPEGDNWLSLCAIDNVGWSAGWSGQYRVTPGLLVTGTVSPRRTSHGNTFTYTANATGGAVGTYQYAFFRRRTGGEWIPSVNAPSWQTGNTYTWTPAQSDVGTWETYVWVKDANTTPTQNGYGYGAGVNTQPIEVLPALTLSASRSPATSRAGDAIGWTAFADGGDPATYEFAFFRRRPGGTWTPDVNAPDWQSSNVLTWTPTSNDLGVWETYVWVKDATTPPTQNTYGYGAGFNTGPVEIIEPEEPDFAIELTPTAGTIVRGSSSAHTISITGNTTFGGTVSLSVSGLPPSSSHTLNTSEIGVGDTATLTVATTADTLPGTYDVTITAEGSGLTRTAAASLTVRLPAATGAPVIDSISPDSFDGGVVKTLTLRGSNFQDATVTVSQEDPDPENPTSRVFPTVGQVTISPDGTQIDVQVDTTAPGVMDFYALVVNNGVGEEVSPPFRVIPQGPVVDLVTPSKPERGEDNVYVLTLGGFHLDNATVHSEPAGRLVIFGVDTTETHVNGLMRVLDDAPLGPVDLVVTGSTGLEARITIEIVSPGTAMIATQRLGTQRIDPVTLRAIDGPSPTVLFQRFAVRDPEATEVTEKGMKLRTATSMQKLSARSITFTLHYRYTLNLLNFSWVRAFTFDPLTQRIGDEILKNLGLGDKVRLGAFVLSFALRVDLTIDVYITNRGFTWPRFCIQITTAIQIPGTNGFYEQWNFCGGGQWFSFGGGGTDNMNAEGGPCAEVTPEGPPVNGMLYAEVEQTACCSQPIEVAAAGFSRVTGPFNFTTENAGSTTPGPSCTCSVSTPPACILEGDRHTLTAQGQPTGGTYQWRVVRGSDRVRITSATNSYSMTFEAIGVSEGADDVELEMVYTNGESSCTQTVNLSVVDIAPFEFRASGDADLDNSVRNQAEYGLPSLGPVTPGSPPGTTGFHKNMEIRAEIFPCDPALRCKFDFQRVKSGVAVYLDANGNVTKYGTGHCPQGGCPDHDTLGIGDSDVRMDPYPGCSIYVVDSPGVIVGSGSCQGTPNGTTIVTCFTFDEWLNVDGRQDRSFFQKWHAATRIRCNGTSWVLDNSGAGNRIGQGWSPIDCAPGTAYAVTPPPLSVTTSTLSAKTAAESVELLEDPELRVRSGAYGALLRKVRRAGLEREERAEVVTALLELARKEGGEGVEAAPLLAIELLGELHASEAVPVLIQRVGDEFTRIMSGGPDRATPAAQALAKIGEPAVKPLLDLAASSSDEEWFQARLSFDLMRRPAMLREAVNARLAAEDLGAMEQERLRALLDVLK